MGVNFVLVKIPQIQVTCLHYLPTGECACSLCPPRPPPFFPPLRSISMLSVCIPGHAHNWAFVDEKGGATPKYHSGAVEWIFRLEKKTGASVMMKCESTLAGLQHAHRQNPQQGGQAGGGGAGVRLPTPGDGGARHQLLATPGDVRRQLPLGVLLRDGPPQGAHHG